MTLPKWNEERTAALEAFVGDESPVSQETVAAAAETMETTTRSISSKLRKLGFEVDLVSAGVTRAYTEEQESVLRTFVEDNSGVFTYAEIADSFEDGKFSPKSIQGKILSMELTDHVKPAPKAEVTRTYSPEEEAVFVKMAKEGAFVEMIATELDRTINSIRGKALSLLRAGEIDSIPKQEFVKGGAKTDLLSDLGDVSKMTVENIAEAIDKTVRGVKTMLTRRGLIAADYDGASKKESSKSA